MPSDSQQINVIDVKPILVSVPQAAQLLGIRRWKAYELVKAGSIPSITLGERCIRIPVAALEQWAIEAARTGQAAI